jgi:lipopolysaccharide export LptBFGC system permease protein LptF
MMTGCTPNISEEEVIRITQDFVNENVKFYVFKDNESFIQQKADITIQSIQEEKGAWNVYLNVRSNQSGQTKTADLLITVDSRTGEVVKWGKLK